MPLDLARHSLLAVPGPAFIALRAALTRDTGQAAGWFQEAGYSAGESMYAAFAQWLDERGGGEPQALEAGAFQRRASEFFTSTGWGTLTVGSIGDAVITLDSRDWREADPASGSPHPTCNYSAGMFADFFTRVGGAPVGAYEVECRSTGAERCRFLVGSAETLQHVYEGLVQGVHYEQLLVGA